jgi:hypothetical protein
VSAGVLPPLRHVPEPVLRVNVGKNMMLQLMLAVRSWGVTVKLATFRATVVVVVVPLFVIERTKLLPLCE